MIIYTYDRKDYIIRALDSVLNQTVPRPSYEIIIVKGFVDREMDEYITKHADKSIFVDEKGHGKKLAAGIRASSGDVIFLLDDDDEFTEEKLGTCLNLFNKSKRLVFLHNSNSMISESGGPLEDERVPENPIIVDTESIDRKGIASLLHYRTNWYSSCMSFRREVLVKDIEELEKVTQSVDPFLFFMGIRAPGVVCKIPNRLTRYRIHPSTTTYAIPFADFINRRREFYSNSSENFQLAVDFSKSGNSEKIIAAMKTHMDTIAMILNEKTRRGQMFSQILKFASTAKTAFTRYQLYWLLYSWLRLLSYQFSMRLYYNYYRNQIKKSL